MLHSDNKYTGIKDYGCKTQICFNLWQECSSFWDFFFPFSFLCCSFFSPHVLSLALDIFVYLGRHCIVITIIRLLLDNIAFQQEENPLVILKKWAQDFYLNATMLSPQRLPEILQMYFLFSFYLHSLCASGVTVALHIPNRTIILHIKAPWSSYNSVYITNSAAARISAVRRTTDIGYTATISPQNAS